MLRLSVNVSRKLLCTTRNIQKFTECKCSRLAHNPVNVSLRNNFMFNVHKHSRVHAIYIVRHQSTADSTTEETVLNTQQDVPVQQTETTIENTNSTEADKFFISEIPDAPIPPSEGITNNVIEAISANGEPLFSSLGLGGYGPIGLTQYCLEWLHVDCDLPWWAAIATVTLIVKVLTIPPSISTARNNAKMCNILPELTRIQDQMTQARNCGNQEEAAIHAYELQTLLKQNGISVLSVTHMFIRILLHIPVFMALREMANLPVESLKTGGLWWFTDLSTTDPYYILPLFTSVGLFLVTENAMRSGQASTMNPLVRYMMRGIPVVTFLFAMNFPGAVLCYWVLSTFITVIQNEILRREKVKLFLNIPLPIVHEKKINSILKKKNFKEAFSESWTNIKISNKVANHLRADQIQFNEAGKGPLKKTFKYNPMKNPPAGASASTIAAMKK